ncbi:MAG: Unknown protein [uncultured Sulfurovum sp.]|uniref:Uncharacterized protein n=1 Tax=uncultured Sulfurovum sp. TaxID=269237 RepID=A0A6S6SS04_9BACT|nr:MAG: Unknown protein [uncultured Sulfurovum sp.]
MDKTRLHAGTTQYRGESNNLLELRAYIEFDKYSLRGVFHLSVYQDRKRDDEYTITMQFDIHQLRQIIHAIKLSKDEKTEGYTFYTGGSGVKKKMLIILKNQKLYVNFSSQDKKIYSSFDTIEKLGLIGSLECIANTIESKVLDMGIQKSQKEFKEPLTKKIKEKDELFKQTLLNSLNTLSENLKKSKVLVEYEN